MQVKESTPRFLQLLDVRVKNFGAPYLAYAVFGIINYLSVLHWWGWHYYTENILHLAQDLISLLFCLILLVRNYWPCRLKKYLPLYFYLCIWFTLPFTNAYYFFLHPHSPIVGVNNMFILFIMILIVDWLSFTILLALGVLTAFLLYYMLHGTPDIPKNILITTLYTLAWTIIAGIFFSRSTSRLRLNLQLEKQLSAIKSVVANIAHELRTPLLSIRAGAAGIKLYLPKLIETYKSAKEADLNVPPISNNDLNHIEKVIDNLDSEVTYSNTVIDSLLINANKEIINPDVFDKHTIVDCIQAAILRFPFNPKNQIDLIHFDKNNDFSFHGDDLLVTHIIFNLLKNAFYVIAEVNKGEVYIRLAHGRKFNTLYFKDTAKGMSKKTQEKLFNTFYSKTPNNTGMGLAYCKLAMESFGGKIAVNSKPGEYTEFVLKFPHIKVSI